MLLTSAYNVAKVVNNLSCVQCHVPKVSILDTVINKNVFSRAA